MTFLLLLAASSPSVVPSWGSPDPLGSRPRPVLNPPPPPPAKKPSGSDTSSTTGGNEAKTGVTSGARATEAPERPEPAAVDKGGAGKGGAAKTIGAEDGSYLLGPKDQLKIEIWNRAEPEYEWRPVTVTDDGTVNLPLLDNVKVGGLTVNQVRQHLTQLYNKFIIEPQVFIQISEYNSRQVNVIGEVKNPGRYALKGDLSVMEVIAQAGDLTKYASKIVRIIREPVGQQHSEVIEVDLSRINAGDPTGNIKVRQDDTVYVLTNKNIVYVSGMVKTEGYVDWEDGMTAQQAIILAGGWAEGAAPSRTKVIRYVQGKPKEFGVNLKDSKKPFPVQPGDIIKIPKSII